MSEATSEASSGPPPTVDVQDPLPESAFFYRRVFSYALSIGLLALLGVVVWRMESASELKVVAGYLCLLLFVIVTYYMIAPSAEQVVKMLQTAKLLARGVVIEKEAKASRTQAESRTRVGPSTDVATQGRRRPMSPQRGFPDPPFGD